MPGMDELKDDALNTSNLPDGGIEATNSCVLGT